MAKDTYCLLQREKIVLLTVLFVVDNVYKHIDVQHCMHDVRVWVYVRTHNTMCIKKVVYIYIHTSLIYMYTYMYTYTYIRHSFIHCCRSAKKRTEKKKNSSRDDLNGYQVYEDTYIVGRGHM